MADQQPWRATCDGDTMVGVRLVCACLLLKKPDDQITMFARYVVTLFSVVLHSLPVKRMDSVPYVMPEMARHYI